jgi:hypothetical protein
MEDKQGDPRVGCFPALIGWRATPEDIFHGRVRYKKEYIIVYTSCLMHVRRGQKSRALSSSHSPVSTVTGGLHCRRTCMGA